MRYRSRLATQVRSRGINMTPMIDITFLLLTFFMLASHLASAERLPMEVPRPDDSKAVDPRLRERLLVTARFDGQGQPPLLMLGPSAVASLDELGGQLAEIAADRPQIPVILRADRRLPFGEVRKVMEALAAGGFTDVKFVARAEEGLTDEP